MDILDRLVELAQIKGSVDVQCLFQGEWYVRHEPKRAHGLVHIVTAGSGYIRIDGEQGQAAECGGYYFLSAQRWAYFEQRQQL